MAILKVIPRTSAECNQLISILHSNNLGPASTSTKTISPNVVCCIWTLSKLYCFNRRDYGWADTTITVNQLASKLK
ncbi:hypothetical protein APK86_19 [Acinetobacter phage APK86]|uniref:Uncharacterized protein n=1 Tax=Acinetobacter phage APK86 TaxID=2873376 RepID=A0AAE8XKN4_9CAUD|nr:hypothetical protein APK86_19 [Acinetobacter phage APK86]